MTATPDDTLEGFNQDDFLASTGEFDPAQFLDSTDDLAKQAQSYAGLAAHLLTDQGLDAYNNAMERYRGAQMAHLRSLLPTPPSAGTDGQFAAAQTPDGSVDQSDYTTEAAYGGPLLPPIPESQNLLHEPDFHEQVARGAYDKVREFTTIPNLAVAAMLGPASRPLQALAGAYFAPGIVRQGATDLGEGSVTGDPRTLTRGVLGTALGAAAGVGVFEGMRGMEFPRGPRGPVTGSVVGQETITPPLLENGGASYESPAIEPDEIIPPGQSTSKPSAQLALPDITDESFPDQFLAKTQPAATEIQPFAARVYHGHDDDFEPGQIAVGGHRRTSADNDQVQGAFVTPDPDMAQAFGKNVTPYDMNLERPLDLRMEDPQTPMDAQGVAELMQSKGLQITPEEVQKASGLPTGTVAPYSDAWAPAVESLTPQIKAQGFDGVLATTQHPTTDKPTEEYIAFNKSSLSPSNTDDPDEDYKNEFSRQEATLRELWPNVPQRSVYPILHSTGDQWTAQKFESLPADHQRKIDSFFGSKQAELNADRLEQLRLRKNNFSEIRQAATPAELGATISHLLASANPTPEARADVMTMALKHASEMGWDKTQVQAGASNELARHFGKDAVEMGKHIFRGTNGMRLKSEESGATPIFTDLANATMTGAKAFNRAIRTVIAPDTVSPEARQTALSIRDNSGQLARQDLIAHTALNNARKMFNKAGRAASLDFIHRQETGATQASPALESISKTLRDAFAERVKAVRALGTGKLENVIENYFPHIWKDPAKAKAWMATYGKRPLQGSGAFLKKRSIPYTKDGMEPAPKGPGLEPVSTNPVDLALLKLHEIDRYVMAHRILNEMKVKGLAKFVKATSKPPDGYKQIDDRIATVFGKPSHPGAQQIEGRYYAPEDAARVINNYLSPGLSGHLLYDVPRAIGNHMNQFQLGLSGFHALGVTINSGLSRMALGIKEGLSGSPVKGMVKAMTAPIAPAIHLWDGSKVMREYARPGSQGADVAKIADALAAAGGRVGMQGPYRTNQIEKIAEAFRNQNPFKASANALLRLPFSAVEAAAWPIMNQLVPRMKVGVMAEMARHELERLPAGYSREQMREVMAKSWDSVDNRLGQVVYDNLFWNKIAKDLAFLLTRAPGWNLGTIRELIGGVKDAFKAVGDVFQGKKPKVTHRMAYAMALNLGVALMGAIYMKLRSGKSPETLKDYFYPRTGRKLADGSDERVAMPTYVKDEVAYRLHAGQTILNKMHPLLSLASQLLQNKDYFRNQIYDPKDTTAQKAIDIAKYSAKETAPFSITNQSQRVDKSLGARAESLFGIVPAPRELTRTPAMQALWQYEQDHAQQTHSKQEAAKSDAKFSTMEDLRQGKISAPMAATQLKEAGFSAASVKMALKDANIDPRFTKFKYLPLEEAQRIFKLATPQEAAIWAPVLMAKQMAASTGRKTSYKSVPVPSR